ncbi:hypothetical protein FRB94_013911 [Tulasnella sp. JGI-2019a]|nr:hypothetical protein FRB93_002390 [Tulasnella sp. JGI-2019a]KAG9007855.1 hypothetical protein FRB94_013911 [Tulasnella sp. JGI-2019a]
MGTTSNHPGSLEPVEEQASRPTSRIAKWISGGPLDELPPFDPEESRLHNSIVLNSSNPAYIVCVLEDILLPRYRVPYLLIRAANTSIILDGQDPVFDTWLVTYRQKVAEHHKHQLTIWHAPRRNIEAWVPTSHLLEQLSSPRRSPAVDNQALMNLWSQVVDDAPHVIERYFKSLCVETNIRDGVFRICQDSISNVVRTGFYYGVINRVERDSAVSNPDKILRIIKDTHEALQYVYDIASTEQPVTPQVVLKLHELLMRQQKVTSTTPHQYVPIGRFRTGGLEMRRMEGYVQFCPPDRVIEEVNTITGRIQELLFSCKANPIGAAAWIHMAVMNCSPFASGNGRMARLLASLPLIVAGLPPMTIPCDVRNEYAVASSRVIARLEANYSELGNVIVRGMMETIRSVEKLSALTEEDYQFQTISGLELRLSSIETDEYVRDAVIQVE